MAFTSMKLILFCLILFNAVWSDEVQPGLRVAIKDSAIKAFEEHFIPQLFKNFSDISLPDQNLTTHVDFLGNLNLLMSGMKIKIEDITSEMIQVMFNYNNTISVSLSNLGASINFGYEIRTNFYNNIGKGVAGFRNLTFVMENSVFALENQHSKQKYGRYVLGPGLNIKNLVLSSVTVDVKFDNAQPLESLITFLIDNVNQIFQKQIKDFLQEQVVPQANVALNTTLENINLIGSLPNTGISIDYSLSEPPKVSNNAFEVSFNATLFTENQTFKPENASIIPHVTTSSKQVELFLNQYVINSLISSLQTLNQLNFYVPSERVNTSLIGLDTKSVGLFVANLSDVYGDDKKIDIQCNSTKTPSFTIGKDKASGSYYADCDFIVRVNESYKEVAFTGALTVDGQVKLYLEKGFLKGEVKTLSIADLTVIRTKIGEIDGKKLKNFFNFLFSVGTPVINSIVFKNTGIELPSVQGLSFKDTDLTLNDGYVKLDMNPLFNFKQGNERVLRFLR